MLDFALNLSGIYRVIAFDCAWGDVYFVSVFYDCVEMLYGRVNVVLVCNLEVLLVSFYCGGEEVPACSDVICVLAFWFALVGHAYSVFDPMIGRCM